MIGQAITDSLGPDDRRAWALPNGRYIYQDADGKFSVQPPNDNWFHSEPTLEAAVAWFEQQISAR